MFGRKLKKRIAELEGRLASFENSTTLTGERLAELLDMSATTWAGPVVNSENSKKCAAVFACVRLIAGAIGSLPCMVYRRTDDGRQADHGHPLFRLLHDEPHALMSAAVFWETAVSHILLHGNSYSVVGRTYGGETVELLMLDPRAVTPERKDNRLRYAVTLDDGSYRVFDQDDILHLPNIFWDGTRGMSTISAGAQAIGVSLAAEEHSARFFSNGAKPSVVLRYPNKVDKDTGDLIRQYWQKKHAGSENAHLPAIITEGGDIKTLTMSSEDAQLIESRQFQVIDICRLFGVPPHMVGETTKSTSWGTGIEQQSIGFVVYTLKPFLTRIEHELRRKLFRAGTHFAEFNVDGLLRGDSKARHEAYRIARGGNQEPGYMTINEIRRLQNLPTIAGGDELYRPDTGSNDNPTEPDNPADPRRWMEA